MAFFHHPSSQSQGLRKAIAQFTHKPPLLLEIEHIHRTGGHIHTQGQLLIEAPIADQVPLGYIVPPSIPACPHGKRSEALGSSDFQTNQNRGAKGGLDDVGQRLPNAACGHPSK